MANPFLEESLPVSVRLGASYSDEYAVEITRTASGQEHRKLIHPFPVRRFSVHYTKTKGDIYEQILALYHRAYGKFKGFRVRAMDDYSTNGATGTPTASDQLLPRLSAGVYQLQKTYGATGASRTIYKPVSGTVVLAGDGLSIPEALVDGFTVDTTTGQITVDPAPAEGVAITGGCLFDIPCRFDGEIDITPLSPNYAETGEIAIVELINP